MAVLGGYKDLYWFGLNVPTSSLLLLALPALVALQMMIVLRNRLTVYCSIHLGHYQSGVRDADMAFGRTRYVEPHIYQR